MNELIKEYLVGLGFKVDSSGAAKFEKTLKAAAKGAAAAMTAFLAGATAVAKFMKNMADQDAQLEKTAKQLKMAKEEAFAHETALKSMGKTYDEVKKDADLTKTHNDLVKVGSALSFPDSSKGLSMVRSIIDGVNKLKVTFQYGLQWINHHLLKMVEGPLQKFRDAFEKLNMNITGSAPEWTKAIALVLSFFVRGASVIVTVVTSIIGWINKMPNSIKLVGAAFAALGILIKTGPMGVIITLISGIILLLDDLFTYMDGGESAFGDFWGKLLEWVEAVKPYIDTFVEGFSAGLDVIIGAVQWVLNLLGPEGVAIIAGITAAVWLLNVAMNANPIFLIITVIGALITGIGLVVKNFDKIKAAVGKAWDAIKNAFGKVGDWFKNIFGSAFRAIRSFFGGIGKWFSDRWSDIKGAFSGVGSWFSTKFGQAKDWATGKWDGIKTWASNTWGNIKDGFGKVGDWFSTQFQNGKDGAETAWSNVKTWASNTWGNIKDGFGKIGDWFSTQFREGKENAESQWENVKSWASTTWGNIQSGFNDVGGWFQTQFKNGKDGAETAWNNATTWASGVWGNIKAGFNGEGGEGIAGWFGEKFGGAWSSITSIFSWEKISEVGKNLIDGFVSGITNAWETAKETVTNVFTGFWDGVKGFFGINSPSTVAAEAGGNITEGFAQGTEKNQESLATRVGNVFTNVWEGVKGIFSGIGNFFGGIFGGGADEAKDSMSQMEDDASKEKDAVVDSFDGLSDGIGGEFESAASRAYAAFDGMASYFETLVESIKTNFAGLSDVITSAQSLGGGSGSPRQNAVGGRYDKPTYTTLVERGKPEYVIPTDNPSRAISLVQSLLRELGSAGAGLLDAHQSFGSGSKAMPAYAQAGGGTTNVYNVNANANIKVASNHPEEAASRVNESFSGNVIRAIQGIRP